MLCLTLHLWAFLQERAKHTTTYKTTKGALVDFAVYKAQFSFYFKKHQTVLESMEVK